MTSSCLGLNIYRQNSCILLRLLLGVGIEDSEGNVFVLKGACEEYYNYFNLSERPQGAGAFRVMEFNENDPYGPSPYMGN